MSYELHRVWCRGDALFAAVQQCFVFVPGDDRATGVLYSETDHLNWPAGLSVMGPAALAKLRKLTGISFPICAFQAYRNGSGCPWHADTPFGAQAILSLGVTRTFGLHQRDSEPLWIKVTHGDLLFMPSGFQAEWEHCVPVEDVTGERISLVFRTPCN